MLHRIKNTANLIVQRLKSHAIRADHIADYERAAATYDKFYNSWLGKESKHLLDYLDVGLGGRIIDVACGTGSLTLPLAHLVGPEGMVVGVDLSSQMLERARRKIKVRNLTHVKLVKSDALTYLSTLPDRSLDGLVCAWAICYMRRRDFFNEVARVLRVGGFCGLIENTRASLREVMTVFRRTLVDFPYALVKNPHIELPRDAAELTHQLEKRKFHNTVAWDGWVDAPHATGSDVMVYVVRAGIAAGFLNALDPTYLQDVMDGFVRRWDRQCALGRPSPVRHRFCAIVAIKKGK